MDGWPVQSSEHGNQHALHISQNSTVCGVFAMVRPEGGLTARPTSSFCAWDKPSGFSQRFPSATDRETCWACFPMTLQVRFPHGAHISQNSTMCGVFAMVRPEGIEPPSTASKAAVLSVKLRAHVHWWTICHAIVVLATSFLRLFLRSVLFSLHRILICNIHSELIPDFCFWSRPSSRFYVP